VAGGALLPEEIEEGIARLPEGGERVEPRDRTVRKRVTLGDRKSGSVATGAMENFTRSFVG
jgi:hypothetical protein